MWFSVLLCLLASVARGASAAPGSAPKPSPFDQQVQDWTRTWQHRLHLDDWKIDTRVVRQCDLKPDTLGNLKWNLGNHTAVIRVLSPSDYDIAESEIAEDMEYTVVHELIHLQLAVLPRDPAAKSTEEGVVNKIADALMSLDKGPAFRARSTPPKQGYPGDARGDTAVRQGSAAPARHTASSVTK
jgi:hypothetical protein